MKYQEEGVTRGQILLITFAVLFNVRLLYLASKYAQVFEGDAWIALFIAGIIASLGGLALYLVAMRFPKMNIYQYSQIVFGKYLGGFFITLNFFILILEISLSIRAFVDGIDSFLLDRTPAIVVMGSFLLVVMYLVNCGLDTIVKVFQVTFPITLLGLILIILLPLKVSDWGHLLPILPEGFGHVVNGLPITMTSYIGFGILGFLMPKCNDKRLATPIIGGILTATIFKTMLSVTVFSYYGLEELKRTVYPVLSMAKGIQIAPGLFERAETFFMLAWIPITFLSTVCQTFLAQAAVVHFFPKIKGVWVSLIIAVAITVIAKLPSNVTENFSFLDKMDLIVAFLLFVFTPLMLLIAWLRGLKSYE